METTTPLTATQIAASVNRSTKAVIDTIHRLGIKPKYRVGRMKLYPPNVIDLVRAEMRAPNKPSSKG